MEQRPSLNDLCGVNISRYWANQILVGMQTDSLEPQFQSLPLLGAGRPLSPESEELRPTLPEPGCGFSVDRDSLPKPLRVGQYSRVPRPRNAFILFRCDFVHQRKMNPNDSENDHVSRSAGHLWNRMTSEEKQPWLKMAEREKQRHATLYPNYKYAPNPINFKLRRTKVKGYKPLSYKSLDPRAFDSVLSVDTPSHENSRGISDAANNYDPVARRHLRSHPYLRRRPSSCPPIGAIPVSLDNLQSWLPPVVSQDDLCRRPSQATMYKSVTYPTSEPILPNPHIPLPHGDDSWFGMAQPYLLEPVDSACMDPSDWDSFFITSTPREDNTRVCPLLPIGRRHTYMTHRWKQVSTEMPLDSLGCIESLSLEPPFVDSSQCPPTSSKIVDDASITTASDIPPPFIWPLPGLSETSSFRVEPISLRLPRPRRNAIVEYPP